MKNRKRFNPEKLRVFSSKVLQKLGVPEEDADITAKILVATDLRGVESHGVAHLEPFYVNQVKQGIINVRPRFNITGNTNLTAVMDGDAGLGFVAGHHAMMNIIGRAKKFGTGFISVHNSTHFGAAAYYAMMALDHDMIGISMTTGARLMMAPGSTSRASGLNPFAVAVPAGKKHPFILDMSTSVIAFGKIEIAKRQGKPIPKGCVIDDKGNPITECTMINPDDPDWKGGLLPLGGLLETGGYKGFGMAVLIDILCTVLSGAILDTMSNHFFGAIRVDGFRPLDEFKQQMDELVDSIENLPTLPGVKKVYFPGGFEEEIFRDREANGIPLDEQVVKSLKNLSEEMDVKLDIE